jgi:hypothetical protein
VLTVFLLLSRKILLRGKAQWLRLDQLYFVKKVPSFPSLARMQFD